MGNPAAATAAVKTAENESRGNPNQTQTEAGDYGTAAEALNAQKTETHGAAPDGTEERGSRNDSVRYDDKSYTLSGSARLAAVAAGDVASRMVAAGRADEAASFLRRVAAEGGVGGADGIAGAVGPDVGSPVGGKPSAVSDAEEGGGPAADLPPAQTPTGGGQPADAMMSAEIQRKLNELAENKKVTTEVMTQLEDVLKGSNGMSAKAAKDAIAKMAQRAAALAKIKTAGDLINPPTDPAGAGKGPASVSSVPSTGQASHGGSGAAGGGSAATARRTTTAGPSADTKDGKPIAPGNVPPTSMVDNGEARYDLAQGDPDESSRTQANQTAPTDDKTTTGQELHDAGDYRLGARQAAADWSLYDKIGQATVTAAQAAKPAPTAAPARTTAAGTIPNRAAAARPPKQADARSPDEANAASGGDETSRYEKALQGDTAEDEISPGNVASLESPETGAVATDAQRELDRQHTTSTRGTTMASAFAPADRKTVEAWLGRFEKAAVAVEDRAKLLVERKTAAKGSAIARTHGLVTAFRKTEADVKRILAAKPDQKATAELRSVLASLPALIARGEDACGFIDSIVGTEKLAIEKLDRVGPALKLANQQFEWGQIKTATDLHQCVGEYIRMPAGEFAAVTKTAQRTGDVSDRGRQPMRRTGGMQRVPTVVTETPADMHGGSSLDRELATMFED